MSEIKILYVEDEPFLAKIVKESLESRGFIVKHVVDGAFAIEVYRNFSPDICILDVMLPNRDGFSIGKEIRAYESRIPIIFLTAKNQTNDVIIGFESGGNDYIRKPFSVEELILRIQNLVSLTNGKMPTSGTGSIHLGKFEFSPNTYELKFGNEKQKLSHREAEVLKILAENQNFTVERREILKKVWGDDSFFNSRNLDVYIKKLRDYLKSDPDIQIITLKGVGYHFAVGQSV